MSSSLPLFKEQIFSRILRKGKKFLLVQRSSHQEKIVLPSPTPALGDQLVSVCPGLSQPKVSCPPFNPAQTGVVGHPSMRGFFFALAPLAASGVMKQTLQDALSSLERHLVAPPASNKGRRIGELGWTASCSVGRETPSR